MKIGDSCDTFESIHILQLVVLEIKIADIFDAFESIHILQLVVMETKFFDSCDASESIDVLYILASEINLILLSFNNFVGQALDLLFDLQLLLCF